MQGLTDCPGLTSHAACTVLSDLAAAVPPTQAIVELGVYTGRSVCYLGAGAKTGGGAHVWGVDLWDIATVGYRSKPWRKEVTPSWDPKIRRIAKAELVRLDLERQVTLIRDFSVRFAARYPGHPVGLLYIDADHNQAAVEADVHAWLPNLTDNATVVFDDYTQGGDTPVNGRVRDAVSQLVTENRLTEPVIAADRLAITRRGTRG